MKTALLEFATHPGHLSPPFRASDQRPGYYLFLDADDETVALTAVPEHEGTEVELHHPQGVVSSAGDGFELSLAVGRTPLHLKVTSPRGETREIRLTAIRSHPRPGWRRLVEHCPWVPRDSAGELVFDDHMWLFGGYTPDIVADVWRSADGVTWEQMSDFPCDSGVNIPVCFVFDGSMWVTSRAGRLFRSHDGRDWSHVTDEGPWRDRGCAGSIVFDGRMWILGGSVGGGSGHRSDVWSSTDGATWTEMTSSAPWSRRMLWDSLAVLDDKLWLIGGGLGGYHPFRVYNDVWCSGNGVDWELVSDDAAWPARMWHSCAAYAGRLWLFGGFEAEPEWVNFDDTWYSADGESWERFPSPSHWSPRHEISAYVFDDKLWVVGGNAWPLQNDVWTLEVRGFDFITQPALEQYAGTLYRYDARADFHSGAGPLSYRLLQAPEWLQIEATDGRITGIPPAPGTFDVCVEAISGAGESAQQRFSLEVLA